MVDAAGNLYAFWQDRREWLPSDLYFAYQDRRLGVWRDPMKINDYTAPLGYYHIYNSGDLAVDSDQNVYAVWDYSTNLYFSNLSAADLPPRYKLFFPYMANYQGPAW